jgi:hypothetical protein
MGNFHFQPLFWLSALTILDRIIGDKLPKMQMFFTFNIYTFTTSERNTLILILDLFIFMFDNF